MYRSLSFWIKSSFIGIFVLSIVIFTYIKTKDYRSGPIITIDSPQNGATVPSEIVSIKGNVQNATAVYFNDRKIYLTEAGDFQEKLIVPEGYTIIEVSAEDRFHRTTRKRVEIVFTR